jgi:hypothetical protein
MLDVLERDPGLGVWENEGGPAAFVDPAPRAPRLLQPGENSMNPTPPVRHPADSPHPLERYGLHSTGEGS